MIPNRSPSDFFKLSVYRNLLAAQLENMWILDAVASLNAACLPY